MPRSKPAPDVYLAAADFLQAAPGRCAVVEDTVTGVTAGVAAGATVFAYLPAQALHDSHDDLLAAGAVQVFRSMADLPALLNDARRKAVPCSFVLGAQDAWIPGRPLRDVIARHLPSAAIDTWDGGHLLHEIEPQRAAGLVMDMLNNDRPDGSTQK
jgi:pimeloyl-ACP methyl ester carboxylesterase